MKCDPVDYKEYQRVCLELEKSEAKAGEHQTTIIYLRAEVAKLNKENFRLAKVYSDLKKKELKSK